ncbi:MAG: hypothetical protein K0Q50_216 [Vampirovibrio sp.]|nr:hypothetical protein [Vampirovibrio sp.]
MKETTFCTEIVKSIRKIGGWAYKIPDMPYHAIRTQGVRFVGRKPFDIAACYEGQPLAIECKLYRDFKGFGLNQLRDEQIQALNDFWEAGGKALVFLNIRITGIKGKRKHENRLLAFEWPMRFHSKKEIEEMAYIQGSRGEFELKTILESLK